MNRLARLIQTLSQDDLLLIKKDLEAGNIDKILKTELKEREANSVTLCPVCSTPITQGEGFHLQFGPSSLRKKATFDGADCLLYFLSKQKR